jgi:hypothetical protein
MMRAPKEFAVTIGKPGFTIAMSGKVDDEGLHDVRATVAPALVLALRQLGAAEGLSPDEWLKESLIEYGRLLPQNYLDPIAEAVRKFLDELTKKPPAPPKSPGE